MTHFRASQLVWILAMTLGLWAVAAQAHEFRYHYVSLDAEKVGLPPGFSFFPGGINDSGRVSGTVCDGDGSCFVAIYANGAVTILQPGEGLSINARGTIGGFVVLNPDPNNLLTQAALFRGNQVKLIPPQPGEVFAFVFALNDSGTALVESDDASGRPTYVLYGKGQTTVLDFGPTVTNPRVTGMNNQRIISGIEGPSPFDSAHGFRFDPRTGEAALLDPVSSDTLAWGLGINTRGDVLGYSFVSGGALP
jgi:hypothetical protein